MARRVAGIEPSIFFEMTTLANQYQAINLGQGFPDFPCPDFLKEAGIAAIQQDINQYAPSKGRPGLRQAVAAHEKQYYGLEFNPESEILITHGATEAIFAAIMGLVDPGDEVIVFEPYYDSYVPSIRIAGGIPRYCTLRPPDWAVDPGELRSLFSARTRLVIVNTPQNPTGKVFSRDELDLIAGLCREHDVIALVDEVYEHIVFPPHRHCRLATLAGMAGRTVTISSLGKTFSATGWKVGWVLAPAALVEAIFRAHQFITFAGAAPLQEGATVALGCGHAYYRGLTAAYVERRDFLVSALGAAGLRPIEPAGTYFVLVDISGSGLGNDIEFCRHLTIEIGVAAIPASAFYHRPVDGAHLVRFAFCKSKSTLEAAAERLRRLK